MHAYDTHTHTCENFACTSRRLYMVHTWGRVWCHAHSPLGRCRPGPHCYDANNRTLTNPEKNLEIGCGPRFVTTPAWVEVAPFPITATRSTRTRTYILHGSGEAHCLRGSMREVVVPGLAAACRDGALGRAPRLENHASYGSNTTAGALPAEMALGPFGFDIRANGAYPRIRPRSLSRPAGPWSL